MQNNHSNRDGKSTYIVSPSNETNEVINIDEIIHLITTALALVVKIDNQRIQKIKLIHESIN